METEITNMCLITNGDKVLVQHRLPKGTDSWSGLTFPGGHLDNGESIVDSCIREVYEETNLKISNLSSCGFVQWYNPIKKSQYLVFLFKTDTFTGELKSSHEGKMEWMTLDEMRKGKLAPNMEKYIAVFLNDHIIQSYGISKQGLVNVTNQGETI